MCIRDSDHMDELRAYQQVWFETSRRRGTDEHPLELEPVSYTHLDVYKRQA